MTSPLNIYEQIILEEEINDSNIIKLDVLLTKLKSRSLVLFIKFIAVIVKYWWTITFSVSAYSLYDVIFNDYSDNSWTNMIFRIFGRFIVIEAIDSLVKKYGVKLIYHLIKRHLTNIHPTESEKAECKEDITSIIAKINEYLDKHGREINKEMASDILRNLSWMGASFAIGGMVLGSYLPWS